MVSSTALHVESADVIDGDSRRKDGLRVGLIGHGIQLSRTPKMHMTEGRALGLNYRYDLLDTEAMSSEPKINDLLVGTEEAGYAGVNITHPYKQAVIAHLDGLSDAARAIQAVNTVVFRDGKRFGHNTDYWGFSVAFRQKMGGAAKAKVLLLGAGGAGSAVANALVDCNVKQVLIYDPNTAAAQNLAASLCARTAANRALAIPSAEAAMTECDGLVNASAVGMTSHPGCPINPDLLHAKVWVADIIYFPLETQLLAAARQRGCRTMNGSGMAVFQAVRAFELFSGVQPDPVRMRATFDAFTLSTASPAGT